MARTYADIHTEQEQLLDAVRQHEAEVSRLRARLSALDREKADLRSKVREAVQGHRERMAADAYEAGEDDDG